MLCVFKSMSAELFSIEFIASQSPHSMRGIIMGTAYDLLALSVALWIVICIPFTQKLSIWGTGVIGSGFGHRLLHATYYQDGSRYHADCSIQMVQ